MAVRLNPLLRPVSVNVSRPSWVTCVNQTLGRITRTGIKAAEPFVAGYSVAVAHHLQYGTEFNGHSVYQFDTRTQSSQQFFTVAGYMVEGVGCNANHVYVAYSTGITSSPVALYKFDHSGNLIWMKLPSIDNPIGYIGPAMVKVNDTRVALVVSNDLGHTAYLLDLDGNPVAKCGPQDANNPYSRACALTKDRLFVAEGAPSAPYHLWLRRYDLAGNYIGNWEFAGVDVSALTVTEHNICTFESLWTGQVSVDEIRIFERDVTRDQNGAIVADVVGSQVFYDDAAGMDTVFDACVDTGGFGAG